MLWKDPLQCRRFQPQLYGEYIVVRLLMKMEESVYFCKRLSEKDGEVIYSLYEELYSPPHPDCHCFNEGLTYLRVIIQVHTIWQLIQCGCRTDARKADLKGTRVVKNLFFKPVSDVYVCLSQPMYFLTLGWIRLAVFVTSIVLTHFFELHNCFLAGNAN